jgi:type 1 glutamine amidotransferase
MAISRRELLAGAVGILAPSRGLADTSITFEGKRGPGKHKRIVLVSGDEEYRSEEGLPQLAKILSVHHGFTCTVLFSIDKKDGTINPNVVDNIPGLESLDDADLMIMLLRWRDLPDEQMKHIVRYAESGRPIIGLRTATHPFNLKSSPTYIKYTWNNKNWLGGFGEQILGETWVRHHGEHGKQSTRGIFARDADSHPILRGIKDGEIWGPTDVYEVHPIGDSKTLVYGQVLTGMNPTDPPVVGKLNDPMMPIAWTKTYAGTQGSTAKIFTTTMGASQDLLNTGVRRMIVNAAYWTMGMRRKINPESDVSLVGDYKPSPFKFGGFKPGVKPEDLK